MTETVSTQPSQLMFIRSDQASSTNSNSKTYKIAHPVTAKKGHKMLIELLEFECPISFYLFDSFNNVLNVTVVGDATTTTQTYTIPSQNYDVTALVSQLNTLFNAASTPFTIVASYDAPTMKFKLTVAAAGANSSITSFSINTPASTCLKILGYYDNLTVNGTELTGDGVANLNRTENIYIKTPNIRLDNLNGRGEFDNTLCKVQVTREAGAFVHYQNANSDAKFILNHSYLDSITVVLEDDDGHPIDLNKLSYHLTLEFLFIEEEQYLPPASLSEKMGVPKMLR